VTAGSAAAESGRARLALLAVPWRSRVAEAAGWLRARGLGGRVGLILGSGLGGLVDALAGPVAVAYGEIPGFPAPTVADHEGRLVAGLIAGVPTLVMQGRSHAYEGLPPEEHLLPYAVIACLGIEIAVVTNAAGGLNRFFAPGDLMVIRDHVDLHLRDPLRGLVGAGGAGGADRGDGEHGWGGKGGAGGDAGGVGEGGERLRTRPLYDEALSRALHEAGAGCGVPLREGVYASVWGPNYETRAEIGFLRRIGCDAGGMSTAPEAALLGRLGVRVVGLSCITNPSREVGQPELSHAEVIEVGRLARERLARLLLTFMPRLAAAGAG
jgi:purine nucleoside phosphorylase